jgi:hypothetical protein
MFRPSATDVVGPFPIPGWPVTPAMLAALAAAIASGVTDVKYGDREVKYASIADLLKAYNWAALQLMPQAFGPRRRVACFSKGLPPTSPASPCGPEHYEFATPIPWEDRYQNPDLRRPYPIDGQPPPIVKE